MKEKCHLSCTLDVVNFCAGSSGTLSFDLSGIAFGRFRGFSEYSIAAAAARSRSPCVMRGKYIKFEGGGHHCFTKKSP